MANNRSGKNGAAAEGSPPAGEKPISRARRLASRGDAPSPEVMGLQAWAMSQDALTGALDPRDINSSCRAMQTLISVAKHIEPVDALCDRMAMAEKEAIANDNAEREALRQRLIAEKEAELEILRRG